MSHSPSRHKLDKWEAARRAASQAERDNADAQAAASGAKVIAAWNDRVARGAPAEFFPTFRTAIVSGHHRLSFKCPACRQVGDIDLRTVADKHHPRAPISVLIPKLSCRRCCPNPPLAVLLDLAAPRPVAENSLAAFPFDPVRIECRRCNRHGRYTKSALIARFGHDIVGPDLLSAIANCDRKGLMNDPCGAVFPDLARSGNDFRR